MTRTSHDLWQSLLAWTRRPDVRDTADRVHDEAARVVGALITFAVAMGAMWAMGTLTHVWLLGP